MLTEKLKAIINQTVPARGSSVLVCVSGGLDSTVLLHLLNSMKQSSGLSLTVAHIDHQIRSTSQNDVDFVLSLCEKLDVPLLSCSVNVPEEAKKNGESLEMAGRRARRAFFLKLRQEHGFERIALAHHQQDQVETFLMRLFRGTGVGGLTTMKPVDGLWWRPLLDCTRQQLEHYADEHGLSWCEDETNTDQTYQRNLIRHQVLPLLEELNPRYSEKITELIRQFQVDETFWSAAIEKEFPEIVLSREDGLRLSRPSLLQRHEAVRFRLYRYALNRVRGRLQGIDSIHLKAIEALVSGGRSQSQIDLPDAWVARRYDAIWLRKSAAKSADIKATQLDVPGCLEFPGKKVIKAEIITETCGQSPCAVEFDWAKLKGKLVVRSWLAGDRFVPDGLVGHKKIKRLFSDEKIELEKRFQVPLILCGDVIIWVAGLRRSNFAIVDHQTSQILRLELQQKA